MMHFQFWFLQLIIIIGVFGKGTFWNKEKVSRDKRLKGKSLLFMIEGILLLAIAWILKGDAGGAAGYFLVGGTVWLLVGIITYLYAIRYAKLRPVQPK